MKNRIILLFWTIGLAVANLSAQEGATTPRGATVPPLQKKAEKVASRVKPHFARPMFSVKQLEADLGALRFSEKEKEHKDWGYRDAYLFWLRQRSFPNDSINWLAYLRAFLHLPDMPRVGRKSAPGFVGEAPPRWVFRGPTNLTVPYRIYNGEGMTSGRVNDVAFDPTDDTIFYVASAGGGVWKATSGGQEWKSLTDNDGKWENLKVSSVTVDPRNPQILYVGTGDFDGGTGVYGFGIMKSTDGGSHWTNLGRSQLKNFSVRRILVHPDDSQILIAAAGHSPFWMGKLLRSPDGGTGWQLIDLSKVVGGADADWEDVKCGMQFEAGKRYCFAVGITQDDKGEVLRTSDQGVHWTRLKPPFKSGCQQSLAIAPSPTSAGTVYLLAGADKRILKSTNAGDDWTNITGNFPAGDEVKAGYNCAGNEVRTGYNWSQVNYDFFIEAAKSSPPSSADIIFVGLIDIVVSLDGGNTWRSIGKTYQNDAITHNDQHSLAVDPKDPNTVLLVNDGGVYRIHHVSGNEDGWEFDQSLNAHLGLTQFYKIAVNPNDKTSILGGAQDNATPASLGDLGNWSNIGGGDGGAVAINRQNTDIQYASDQYLNLFRTEKSWKDWNSDFEVAANDPDHTHNITYYDSDGKWSGDTVSFVAPIAIDPRNQNLLYAGTNYLWRRDEATGNWERHLGGQMLAGKKDAIATIAIAPSDDKVIYTGSENGQLWVSNNARANGWKRLDGALSGLPRYWITSITVHPVNPKVILVGLSGTGTAAAEHPGHLWKCTVGVAHLSCQSVTGTGTGQLPNVPVNAVVIDPQAPNTSYYAATDLGVFMTKDGGATWGDATKPVGLPPMQVNDLQFVPATNSLFAGTFGRGVWQIDNLSGVTLQPRLSSPASRLRAATTHKVTGKP
ncbi:MAG TPA: hypothetical protein VI386_36525 [Candidatus Sulfotelmatobacter sp.]